MKEFYSMVRGICRGFLAKFLVASFSGNQRTKIGDFFRRIFATFFAHVGESFRQSFALGAFRPNIFRVFHDVFVRQPSSDSIFPMGRELGLPSMQKCVCDIFGET